MAELNPLQAITIADAAKAMPDGNLVAIYDALRRRSSIMSHIPYVEASHPEYHRMTISDVAISGTEVGLYEGVPGTKKPLRQVDEYMSRVEDNSLVDTRVKEYYKDILAYRNKMDTLKVKDLSYQWTGKLFNGVLTDGKGFNGLYSRMSKLNRPGDAQYGKLPPVLDGGSSSGSLSSVIFVSWGEDTVFGIHPKGSKTFGVETEDKGEVRVLDANGNPFWAYETWLTMRGGLGVQENQSIARICNIDVATAGIWATNKIMSMVNKLTAQMRTNGKIYAYLSPLGWAALNDFVQDKTNIQYSKDDFGRPFVDFAGVSWYVDENITNSETRVTAVAS